MSLLDHFHRPRPQARSEGWHHPVVRETEAPPRRTAQVDALTLQLADARHHVSVLQARNGVLEDDNHELAEQILELKRENRRLRGDVEIASARVDHVLDGGAW